VTRFSAQLSFVAAMATDKDETSVRRDQAEQSPSFTGSRATHTYIADEIDEDLLKHLYDTLVDPSRPW
jgi:hypothetical protein